MANPEVRRSLRASSAGAARHKTGEAIPFEIEDNAGHYFNLYIPETKIGDVKLTEVYAPGSGGAEASSGRGLTITKGRMPLAAWLQIDDRVRAEFNGRLRDRGGRPGSWGPGDNRLSVYFGWEVGLLLWGGEGSKNEEARRIFAFWSNLAPEERWWLYNAANAQGENETSRDVPWRRALRLVFQDLASEPAAEREARRRAKSDVAGLTSRPSENSTPGLFDEES